MKVRLTHGARHATDWTISYPAGSIVPVIFATNQPDYQARGLVFIDTPELRDDPYGILLDSSDYTRVYPMPMANSCGEHYPKPCPLLYCNRRGDRFSKAQIKFMAGKDMCIEGAE